MKELCAKEQSRSNTIQENERPAFCLQTILLSNNVKWKKKYDIDLNELHAKNVEGYSLPELSEIYGIPRTTLNRYLSDAGFTVYFNRNRCRRASWKNRQEKKEFACKNSWRRALLEIWPHECYLCGYKKIVEAHHIIPQSEGGKSTRENGVLLCPNHHAEAHAEILCSDHLEKLVGLRTQVKQQAAVWTKERKCDFETRS